ncbi:preprotein translocase subunit SecE [Vagococcus vulneris]|uniref:Protein translocase subunit SecE n=1 Tax=Vagococcus vulneris TaxID=1977869 RepID=A0A429ZVD7_9ENTE|nr:preprotein translocase subunit SecE [Vagococcus vulneris]RST97679.1 preprotein translocase subunit SecE [Vagococcus vulneris]
MKFLKSVIEEMKVVTWPTKFKLTKDVITVIQSTILFALFFAVVDFGLDKLLKLFIR